MEASELAHSQTLQANFANRTDDQCLAYTGKDYDRYKNPKHQPCKCDFFDLFKICKKCNESCERLFARISKDTEIAEDEELQTNPYEIATKEVLKGADIDKVITKYASSCKKDTEIEKSKLCKDLFSGMYEKDDIKQFEEYNNEEFNYNCDNAILLDDFYGLNI
ncbi:13201_t:CDS:2, partial [Dentiscutata heterogama]